MTDKMHSKQIHQTFCVAIDAPINTKSCPLQVGACYWQHRQTKECKYTELDMSIDEFKLLVGSNDPASDIDEFRDRLRRAL
jgi:hypothetical protein